MKGCVKIIPQGSIPQMKVGLVLENGHILSGIRDPKRVTTSNIYLSVYLFDL